jgi:hypothetical protein
MDTSKEVFEDQKVYSLGIDVDTSGKGLLISKLVRLKSTKEIMDGGPYWEDKTICQVWIKTTMNEDELDEWLYSASFVRNDFDIHGVFEKEWD